ncbi:MAG: hypothetical protein LW832_05705 [Parachlamydia sp.]|jgi:predicted RND superfamily exporter protein|nr:hypothetical protein [Parachlamydia sp.]
MSPFVGYAAAGLALSGFSAVASNHTKINTQIELGLVAAVGLASVAAVGMAFGPVAALALAGFEYGCVLASENQHKPVEEKIALIAILTIIGATIG